MWPLALLAFVGGATLVARGMRSTPPPPSRYVEIVITPMANLTTVADGYVDGVHMLQTTFAANHRAAPDDFVPVGLKIGDTLVFRAPGSWQTQLVWFNPDNYEVMTPMWAGAPPLPTSPSDPRYSSTILTGNQPLNATMLAVAAGQMTANIGIYSQASMGQAYADFTITVT